MPVHEHCLLWPIDVGTLILKFRSKIADQREITGFPILDIWRPFHSHISVLNDLRSWTCILMNNVCNGPLMYIADQQEIMEFLILNIWRPFQIKMSALNDLR